MGPLFSFLCRPVRSLRCSSPARNSTSFRHSSWPRSLTGARLFFVLDHSVSRGYRDLDPVPSFPGADLSCWPGAYPDAPVVPFTEPLSCICCPGAYPEAPGDPFALPLSCICCPGAVDCWARAEPAKGMPSIKPSATIFDFISFSFGPIDSGLHSANRSRAGMFLFRETRSPQNDRAVHSGERRSLVTSRLGRAP